MNHTKPVLSAVCQLKVSCLDLKATVRVDSIEDGGGGSQLSGAQVILEDLVFLLQGGERDGISQHFRLARI